jgi:hypothetical protein
MSNEEAPEAAEETHDVADEMDPEAEEMEMTYEQQRLATIRYVPVLFFLHWLIFS